MLTLVAAVAFLYVYPQPYSVWLSGVLSGGASKVDLRDFATDVGGDLAVALLVSGCRVQGHAHLQLASGQGGSAP